MNKLNAVENQLNTHEKNERDAERETQLESLIESTFNPSSTSKISFASSIPKFSIIINILNEYRF